MFPGADDPLFVIHRDLPREGPGTDETTRAAALRVPPLPGDARVLDLGCGPGRQTVVLAQALRRTVTGVDLHPPYLERLLAEAAREGVSDLVRARREDFMHLSDPPESVDLIWSEGAAYAAGFGAALERWREVLTPGGWCVLTELTWLSDHRPEQAAAFWAEAYPDMADLTGNVRRAEAAGYAVVDTEVMPQAAWWPLYYTPLRQRLADLAGEAAHDPRLAAAMAEERREIDVFAASAGSYSYVFYYLRKR